MNHALGKYSAIREQDSKGEVSPALIEHERYMLLKNMICYLLLEVLDYLWITYLSFIRVKASMSAGTTLAQ